MAEILGKQAQIMVVAAAAGLGPLVLMAPGQRAVMAEMERPLLFLDHPLHMRVEAEVAPTAEELLVAAEQEVVAPPGLVRHQLQITEQQELPTPAVAEVVGMNPLAHMETAGMAVLE